MSLHIVMYQPEIPPNTGNIARLCAATDSVLHLVKPLGFSLEDKYMKRAGLDYWQYLQVEVHQDWQDFLREYSSERMFFATTKGHTAYHHVEYHDGDFLVFGPETRGLPPEVLSLQPEHNIRIPILAKTRSLNLSNSVAIILFEALRQTGFDHLYNGEI